MTAVLLAFPAAPHILTRRPHHLTKLNREFCTLDAGFLLAVFATNSRTVFSLPIQCKVALLEFGPFHVGAVGNGCQMRWGNLQSVAAGFD